MDELELSGRRHISAKRAAREHRYHSDYIGQLIRLGKVAGQKVGRSWYVDAESLERYFGGESAPTSRIIAQEKISTPAPTPVPAPAPTAPTPNPVYEIKKEETIPEQVETKIEITKKEIPVEPAPVFVQKESGLRFVADEPMAAETLEHNTASTYPEAFTLQGEEQFVREQTPVKPLEGRKGGVGAVLATAVLALILGGSISYILSSRVLVTSELVQASVIVALP